MGQDYRRSKSILSKSDGQQDHASSRRDNGVVNGCIEASLEYWSKPHDEHFLCDSIARIGIDRSPVEWHSTISGWRTYASSIEFPWQSERTYPSFISRESSSFAQRDAPLDLMIVLVYAATTGTCRQHSGRFEQESIAIHVVVHLRSEWK